MWRRTPGPSENDRAAFMEKFQESFERRFSQSFIVSTNRPHHCAARSMNVSKSWNKHWNLSKEIS